MRTTNICLTIIVFLLFNLSSDAQQATISESKFASAVPERCWACSIWNGAVRLDPNSKNHAEQLLAEPEVRAFVDDLITRVGLIGPAMAVEEPEQKRKLINSLGPKLTHTMLKRAGCFFLEDIEINDVQEIEKIKAALMLDAGEDAARLASQLAQLLTKEENLPSSVTIEGVEFQKFLVNEDFKAELLIGSSKEMLLIGVDEQTIRDVLSRMANNQVGGWLNDFQSNRRLKRVTSIGYFNVKTIRSSLIPFAGPEADLFVSMMGLGNVDSVETCSGFSETDAISRMLVRIDGRPEGLMDLSSRDGIQSASLQPFPLDSLFAIGVSLDPGRLFRFFQMSSSQISRNQDDFGSFLAEVKRETGIDLKQDVVANLGDTWTLHNGAGDGWMTGLTLMGTVKDGKKLSTAANQLIKKILMETGGDPYAPKFVKRSVGGSDVFTFRVGQLGIPFEPSWCITDERIIFGFFPQAVQTVLTEKPSTSLIDQSELAFLTQPFGGKLEDSKLLAMGYGDTATQFEFTYPYLQMMMGMSRMMVEQMSDFSPMASEPIADLMSGIRLPPARTIHRHLRPSLAAIRQTDLGIEFESRQTIPALDASFIAPLAAGMLLPAVQQVRTSARRTQSANNLRQQALAAHNFESAFQNFPAGYSTNQKGEKLLSWRVHILPFIEQNNLYQQFKLDEPWDSDNNKRLIEQMPDVFKSPVSQAKPGMTVYRGVGGKSGVLGPPKKEGNPGGTRFADIVDGSSNTLFLVEATDELAVPWTQPDEGLNPEEFDLKAIFGLYPNGTNVALCDGSVQFIPPGIDKQAFRFLMEMNDGNIVPDLYEMSDRPRRERAENRKQTDKTFLIDNGEVELTIENMLGPEEKAVIEERKKLDWLRQIGLGMHNFHNAHRGFPAAFSTDNQGQPLLSWRVHILPYLDEFELYEQFHLDEPWDSEHNRALLNKMPDVYRLGGAGTEKTAVLAIGGTRGIIQKPKLEQNGRKSMVGLDFDSIVDGSSNTIMLVNGGEELAVEWTKPTEFVPDEASIKKLLGRQNGFEAVMSDGMAQRFPVGFPIKTFQALLSFNGREILEDWWDLLDK